VTIFPDFLSDVDVDDYSPQVEKLLMEWGAGSGSGHDAGTADEESEPARSKPSEGSASQNDAKRPKHRLEETHAVVCPSLLIH